MTADATPHDLYQSGLAHHRSGRLPEAEANYRQVLSAQPNRVDVLNSLAELLFRTGDPTQAGDLLRRAIALSPPSSNLYTNLGIALAAQRQFDDAVATLRHALALQPNSPQILMNLGAVLCDQGKRADAIEVYRQLVSLQPGAAAFYKLAGCLRDGGNLDEAIAAYRQAAALDPNSVQIHNDLANCLYLKGRYEEATAEYRLTIALQPDYFHGYNNLSISLHELGRLDEAVAVARRAIELNPNFPEAWYNLGRALLAQKRFDQTVAACEHALKLRPDYVEARGNLAIALDSLGSLDRAIEEYRAVLAARPDYREARMNYAVSLKNIGRIDEAIATYHEILKIWPDFEEARWNLGIALMLKGDFENGWAASEARRRIKRLIGVRDFAKPPWTGDPLEGRRILLHTEQGFGDAIQFIRYVPMVRQTGGRVIVLGYEPLRRLFTNQLGIEHLVTDRDPLPEFDVHCPLLSLPGVMHTTLQTIPAAVPYLTCDPALIETWRTKLSEYPARLKVGIVWAGSPAHSRDQDRSIPFAALAPLAQVEGLRQAQSSRLRFFSLQKGDRAAEAKRPPAGMQLIDYTSELNDFVDTAALISNLDVVITVDTAVAHLAGALGKPVWLLLHFAPDWRWMLDRTDSPWYPTMRLFRQTRWGDWTMPIQQIAGELSAERSPP